MLAGGIIVLTPAAARVGVPEPVLLTVFGLVLGAVPAVPPLRIDPDLILPIVLPPLLFAATQRSTVRDLRDKAGAVALLAVGLTAATTAAVAVVAHAAGFTWPVAWVLGAVLAAPDPVVATSVARRLRLPSGLVTVIEGEGMFNDATALVLYKVAVAATVTGHASGAGVALDLALSVVVGGGVGLVLGWGCRRALAVLGDARAEITVTVGVPFAAYLGADHLRGSGVLAVLALGLYLRSTGRTALTSGGWLLGRAVWVYADFLITSLTFAALGLTLTDVIAETEQVGAAARTTALLVGTLLAVRVAWIFPGAWAAQHAEPHQQTWRRATVASWAGSRGVVTVATALALPTSIAGGREFPDRNQVITVSLACVLVTLVVQGLTLVPLVSLLGVAEEADDEHQVAELRRAAAAAALVAVRESTQDAHPDVRRAATLQYEGYVAAQEAMLRVRRLDTDSGKSPAAELADVLIRALDAERDYVLAARDGGQVTAAAADEALQDIEGRAIRDLD